MKKDTRELLLDAATIVFSINPGAPISEVAAAAGVGRATLYRHFPSRDALIRELTLESYRQMDAALVPLMEENLSSCDLLLEILKVVIPMGDRYYFLMLEHTFENDPEIKELYTKDAHDWFELFEQLKAEGIIAAEVPTAWAVSAVESLIYSAWTAVHEGYMARREAPGLVYRTLISGLGTIDHNR